MKKFILAAATLAALVSGSAHAESRISIGFFAPAPVYYAPPPPVRYYRPAPVYYAPRVAYYQPRGYYREPCYDRGYRRGWDRREQVSYYDGPGYYR